MRLIKAILALCFIALGVFFGALNRQHVHVDFGVATVGRAAWACWCCVVLLLGALLGGIAVMASVVWPLRRRLRSGGARAPGRATPSR